MVITLACYGVMYSYPNLGGVYAATILAGSVSNAWFPSMWPWRVQTTEKATGSAFAIAFVNSLGQIGSLVGPQLFRSEYAPRYKTSFAVAMGFSALCVLVTGWTWWVTRVSEGQTRRIRRLRWEAAKKGHSVLEDVDFNADVRRAGES